MSWDAVRRANKIRGVTIAERAFYKRLCEFHSDKAPDPFPKTLTLAIEHECSRVYARGILQSLVKKRFIKIKSRSRGLFEDNGDMRTFAIDFDRWFAYKDDESEVLNKKILGVFRRAVPNPHLARGFLAAWVEPRRTRSKRTIQRLWIAVESRSHRRFLAANEAEIHEALAEEIGIKYQINVIDTFPKHDDGN